MKRLAIALALAVASPVAAQEMDHSMHGAGHIAEAPSGDVGAAPAPPAPDDHAADRIYPAERMASARRAMLDEMRFSTVAVMIDRLEYSAGKGRDGYAWEAEGWYGGDIDRFVLATEGEGSFGDKPEQAEVRALWRHALDPWFNLELGVRHDIRPQPQRSYAVIGIEGLAPYWFELEGQFFLSDKGDAHVRAEASYDQRITQSLIVQPRIEIDAAFQDVPELGIGSGVDKIELGARVRYEFAQEFAPYVGVNWERRLGQSASFARAAGEDVSGLNLVLGIRAWF